MSERRLMDMPVADDASPELRALVDKWNEALAAQLDYMQRHPPVNRTHFTKEETTIMELPMLAFLSFVVPLMYDSDRPARMRKLWLMKMNDEIARKQAEYNDLRMSGRAN